MDPNIQKFDEMYRLAKENNKMLHAMRRNAFYGGLIRLVVWAALLGIPVWLFFTYLFPVFETMMEAFEQIQGTGVAAQGQFEDVTNALRDFQSQFTPDAQ